MFTYAAIKKCYRSYIDDQNFIKEEDNHLNSEFHAEFVHYLDKEYGIGTHPLKIESKDFMDYIHNNWVDWMYGSPKHYVKDLEKVLKFKLKWG